MTKLKDIILSWWYNALMILMWSSVVFYHQWHGIDNHTHSLSSQVLGATLVFIHVGLVLRSIKATPKADIK